MSESPPDQTKRQAERAQLLNAATLLQLEKRVRLASSGEEIGFLVVNETQQIVPYRTAFFWLARKGLNIQRKDAEVDDSADQPSLSLSPDNEGEKPEPGLLTIGLKAVGHLLKILWRQIVTALSLIWSMTFGLVGKAIYPHRSKKSWLNPGRLVALSGVARVDREAPSVQWVERVINHLVSEHAHNGPTIITTDDLPENLRRSWGDWFPAHALWVELRYRDGRVMGGLLLTKEDSWTKQHANILNHLSQAYQHSLEAILVSSPGYFPRPRAHPLLPWAALVILTGVMFIPVDLSVLAPAEIVPEEPVVISAPLQGVIATVEVSPNQDIKADDLLLTLDGRDLRNRLAVGESAWEIARTEYEQALKQSFADPNVRPQVAALKGRVGKFRIERDYVRNLLSRLEVRAPQSGVAIFSDPNDLIGRPVEQGERLMMVADANDMKIRVYLPVSESLSFENNSKVRLFLNIDPDKPLDGTVNYISYRATSQGQPDAPFAYRIDASLDTTTPKVRVGLKGTAKIYSEKVSLFYYLLRRPLSAFRQKTGL